MDKTEIRYWKKEKETLDIDRLGKRPRKFVATLRICSIFGIFVVLLSTSVSVCGGEGGIGSPEMDITLQNQRIMCWGRSFTTRPGAEKGATYPDHLGRLLNREVGQRLSDLAIRGDFGVTSKFDEDKYGIIIYQFRNGDFKSDVPWITTEGDLRNIIHRLQETGAVVAIFDSFPVWEVDGNLTALHYLCYTGTSQEMNNQDFERVSAGNETRIKKYYEMWGETLVSEIADEEGAYFIPAYETWDCLDLCGGTGACCDLPYQTHDAPGGSYSWHPGGASLTHIHPDLLARDGLHLNGMGDGVFAERIARYLVDWGLGEYAVSYEEMAQNLPSLYSEVETNMVFIEGEGFSLEEHRKMFEIAKFLGQNGYTYTAKWIMEEKLLPSIPNSTRWEEIVGMVTQANTTIKDAGKAGVDERIVEGLQGCISSAMTSLDELDLNETVAFLQSILDTQTWHNISSMFPVAEEIIKELEDAGDRKALKAKADYDRAKKAFEECDHELAQDYLKMILVIPEPFFACVLTFLFLSIIYTRSGSR
jgi:hypothetical protein